MVLFKKATTALIIIGLVGLLQPPHQSVVVVTSFSTHPCFSPRRGRDNFSCASQHRRSCRMMMCPTNNKRSSGGIIDGSGSRSTISSIRAATDQSKARIRLYQNSSPENDGGDSIQPSSSTYYEYKDDCFGFISFGAGAATGDALFAGIFVVLSLAAATATRRGVFPADTKRPYIVNRNYPGAVAAVTLFLTTPASPVADMIRSTASSALLNSSPSLLLATTGPPDPVVAHMVQAVLCLFSMTTAWLDIRWRDRLDYPQEFQ